MSSPEEINLSIAGPSGPLALRYLLPSAAPRGLAVVCHPHPLHGGTMDNKVVYTLTRTLQALGFVTLRFNFRGVGSGAQKSAGEFDHGVGEQADLAAVVAYARQQFSVPEPLWLAGFSFGSFVSAAAANTLHADQLISIAPPVQRFDFSAMSMPACPWTVLMGDADEVVDPAAVFSWLAQLTPAPTVIRMAGAGHFFHGRLVELRTLLEQSLQVQTERALDGLTLLTNDTF